MENQDKIYTQFKNAAEKSVAKDFPNSDKVWNRLEEKLDKKVLKKQNKLWKKIAVAASILLVGALLFIILKSENEIVIPENQVVVSDTLKNTVPIVKIDSQAVVFTNQELKTEAEKKLQNQLKEQNNLAIADEVVRAKDEPAKDSIAVNATFLRHPSQKAKTQWMKNDNFEARSVKQIAAEKMQAKEMDDAEVVQKSKDIAAKKEAPLMILDGNVTNKNLYNMADDELESIVELKEPLYIINSVYYTEKELFGPDPTSPYAPLNKQKIETISILQPEKATTIYGKKGEKGIVIITTKDGKPLAKKKE